MSVKIKTAANGWILTTDDQTERTVFEHDDTTESKARAFARLLWRIQEILGPDDSRYSPARVVVSVTAGDKYESGEATAREVLNLWSL